MFLIGILLMLAGIYQLSKKGIDKALGVFLIIVGAYITYAFRKITIG